MSNVGLEPGDNIEVHDMESPVTWPLYALVDNAGACIDTTYICATHMADPVARLRCLNMALTEAWEHGHSHWCISPAGFTGIDATPLPPIHGGPVFDIAPSGAPFIVSCTDCWA